jgi:6-pyruvoyltetrahydropterin/6-carboxytetrahydropterin synthase
MPTSHCLLPTAPATEALDMFEIGINDEFEAAHSLSGDFGAATRLHGHTYKVEVRVEAREVDGTGTFYDIGRLRSELRSVLEPLHYRNLNDVIELAEMNTTAEIVARYIFNNLASTVRVTGVESLKVTVWESSSSFASYRESFYK